MGHQTHAVQTRSISCNTPRTAMPNVVSKQEIAGRSMDPEKLVSMLDTKFAGAYEVEMMHNTYSIRAPRELSNTEIAMCRR
ncbi:hypothetical protein CCHR01_05451 [Colletotrichum chrysophilum]|uniref:Uncharacterized protein n=1 Tax=Colletotrichum chrysophilum TaxID=1836956 RepID=A0AAD9AQL1_9PEZI|nr:hypothetical protein CCHR01_05451 [Colletotrichum chrysophilum]